MVNLVCLVIWFVRLIWFVLFVWLKKVAIGLNDLNFVNFVLQIFFSECSVALWFMLLIWFVSFIWCV